MYVIFLCCFTSVSYETRVTSLSFKVVELALLAAVKKDKGVCFEYTVDYIHAKLKATITDVQDLRETYFDINSAIYI